MLNFKCVSFFQLILILFTYSSFFFIVCFSYGYFPNFTTIDFYQTLSSPKECFIIHHHNPTGPKFLLIEIIYELKSQNLSIIKKTSNKNYPLKKIHSPCDNSVTFPNLTGDYNQMYIEIKYFLFSGEKSIDSSVYKLYECVKLNKMIMLSIRNYFGLNVNFSNTVDNNSHIYGINLPEVIYYLRSISKNIGSICVFTEYNQRLILKPKKIFLGENDLITGIKIEYINDEQLISSEYFSAFECYPDDKILKKSVHLVYEGNQSNIQVNFAYWYLDVTKLVPLNSPTIFLNLKIITIDIMIFLPKTSQKLYLAKTCTSFTYISEDTKVYEIYSRSNILLYKRIKKFARVLPNIKRTKLIII